MTPITLVIPYYENPGMLRRQLAYWAAMPVEVQNYLHVILVDDGSPNVPARDAARPATNHWPQWVSIHLYRIKVDVRWNWIACRNLAMHYAATEWCLMTDIDHIVPTKTWLKIMSHELDPRVAYRFNRKDAVRMDPLESTPADKLHPNTWLMTRDLFHEVGGYDERFSGHYGSDGEFRDRVEKHAAIKILPEHVVRVPRELVADASTTTYTRKDPKLDKGHVRRIRSERDARGLRPLRLTFPWERVF